MASRTDLQRALMMARDKGDSEAVAHFENRLNREFSDSYARPVEASRRATEGLTFGFGDEIGAGVASLGVLATTDKGFSDLPEVYGDIMSNLKFQRQEYAKDRPVESIGAEMLGGAAGGIAMGAKLAGTKIGQQVMANTPRWVQAAGMGGATGAVYGAGAADPGERVEGAVKGGAIGAIAAPVLGYATDKVSATLGAIGRWAKNKLASTPKTEAIRAIRTALQAEGIDPDEAIAIYNRIGPDATMADIGENFRAAARVAVDVPGATKANARGMLNQRQMGQQGRLLNAAQEAVGQKADDLVLTVKDIAKRRAEQATPAYEKAWADTFVPTEDLTKTLARPAMKSALGKASNFAKNLGDDFDPGSLKHLHYAKMALDEMLKQRKFPRDLMQVKKDLLKAIDAASPAYKAAREQFAGDSELLDAAMAGRQFLKTAPDELADLAATMTAGEKDMFKLGAMAGVQDFMDGIRSGNDAADRLIGTPAQLKRLAVVFDSEASAKKFLEAAWREGEMGRTRAVLTGGSPTAERLAGKKWLEDAIQPESLSAIAGGPVAMAMEAAKAVLSKQPLSQQALDEMGRMLLTQGMPEAEVRKVLASPQTMQVLQNLNREFISRAGAAGAAPALVNQE